MPLQDIETIARCWHEHPDANIGVACGTASGINVVDVDAGGSRGAHHPRRDGSRLRAAAGNAAPGHRLGRTARHLRLRSGASDRQPCPRPAGHRYTIRRWLHRRQPEHPPQWPAVPLGPRAAPAEGAAGSDAAVARRSARADHRAVSFRPVAAVDRAGSGLGARGRGTPAPRSSARARRSRAAPFGQQEITLAHESYNIGGLVGGGVLSRTVSHQLPDQLRWAGDAELSRPGAVDLNETIIEKE